MTKEDKKILILMIIVWLIIFALILAPKPFWLDSGGVMFR